MPVFILDEEKAFPGPELAEPDGLLAIGGDLSPERLLKAYASGIFPWYSDGSPILWWSPDPRMILIPGEFKISKSLRQTLRKNIFEVRFDEDFEGVISACAQTKRKGEEGTWITSEMMQAYIKLHKLGYAHSVEAFKDGKLAGGLYGVSLGAAFFGESMFFLERDASKVALAALVARAIEHGITFIDVQQRTDHLRSLGARPVAREVFQEMLEEAICYPTFQRKW